MLSTPFICPSHPITCKPALGYRLQQQCSHYDHCYMLDETLQWPHHNALLISRTISNIFQNWPNKLGITQPLWSLFCLEYAAL